jgi:hypothetical protein
LTKNLESRFQSFVTKKKIYSLVFSNQRNPFLETSLEKKKKKKKNIISSHKIPNRKNISRSLFQSKARQKHDPDQEYFQQP